MLSLLNSRCLILVFLFLMSLRLKADTGIPVLSSLDEFTQKTIEVYQNSYGWFITINISVLGALGITTISHLKRIRFNWSILLLTISSASASGIAIYHVIEMQEDIINQLVNHFFEVDQLTKPSTIAYLTFLGSLTAACSIGMQTAKSNSKICQGEL